MELPRGGDLSLQTSTLECMLHVVGAEIAKHRDNAIPSEVRGVGHRWSPVPFDAARVLDEQRRVLDDERAYGHCIVAPDRVGHPAGEDESWPAGESVAARELVLRLGQLRVRGIAAHLAHEIFRLMLELFEIGPNGEMTIGHDGPPSWRCPRPLRS